MIMIQKTGKQEPRRASGGRYHSFLVLAKVLRGLSLAAWHEPRYDMESCNHSKSAPFQGGPWSAKALRLHPPRLLGPFWRLHDSRC